MTIRSDTYVEAGKWQIDKLWESTPIGEDDPSWWVLRTPHVSIPFDKVKAGGGLLNLHRGDEHVTIPDTLTGMNEYDEDSDIPEEIVKKLQEIGPW